MWYIYFPLIYNLIIIWASTRILIKVCKEIKSRSTKRHKKNIPVLYFCSVLTDQNKQCTENQFRCLTTVYKGIKQINMFHSSQKENQLHVNEYAKENAVKDRKAYSDVLVNAIVKLR